MFHQEKVLLKLHRHPLVLFLELFPFCILLGVPSLLSFALTTIQVDIVQSDLFLFGFSLLRDIFYLYIFLFIFYIFFAHYLDIWIVTENHIVNIEQKTLFYRSIAEQEIDRIQDITAEIKGPFQTLFNYGTIYIQTAGTQERFIFKDVAHPHHIVTTITKLLDEKEQQKKTS